MSGTLVVALAAGLAVWLGCPSSARAETADKLLPPESVMVFHVNLKNVQDSKLFKKYVAGQLQNALRNDENLRKFQEETGINVLKDIHSVSLAFTKLPKEINPNNPVDVNPKDFELLVILRGQFSRDSVVRAMKKNEDLTTQKYRDHTIFSRAATDDEQQSIHICVADDGLIIFSNELSRLKKSLDSISADSKPSGISPELKAVIEAIPQRQSFWFAMNKFQLLKDLAQNDPNAADLIDKFVGASLSIAVTDKVTVGLRAHATDADAAREFRAGFEKLRAILVLAAASDKNLGQLLQDVVGKLKTDQKGSIASIELELNEAALKTIFEQLQRMMGGAAPFPNKID
ncbi:MAG: DUF3352 domain-containing protein [Gemmatales bacterium]|nr:DUF3352 domain-containing protein [Gemmatales bacterium]MCS7160694.1 DUF3352 domain-containing protein [Gemmatales bacterium]